MTTQPHVSVVVPAYNAASTIDRCLDALADQTFPMEAYEIIVVDDGSTDDTRARVGAHAGVQLVTQDHAGPAAARNLGAQRAMGDILLFTDADCAPARDWIERMCAALDDTETVGVKGAYMTPQREIVARFAQLEYEAKYDRMAQHRFIDFIDTYAAGYRREVFLANGGFDPAFPNASVEDQEFSFRLAHQGLKMVFIPDALVYHLAHPGDVWTYWRRKFRIGYWKVLVTKRYPDKVWHDSHTPQILKLQILLVALQMFFFFSALLWQPMIWGFVVAMLLCLLTMVPFLIDAAGKDPPVAMVAPGLLLLRALALGTGFAAGLATHRGSWQTPETTKVTQVAPATKTVQPASSYQVRHKGWRMPVKRAIDIIGATIGFLLSVPIVLIAAILVKLDSPGPAFFVQDRVGKRGRVFKIYKLRTMVENAEEQLDRMIDLEALDEPVFKLRDDPRTTRVGRFLRRWSIDEAPQFLNVLKGDMSLVGPRPEEVRMVDYYNARHRQRLRIRPGLTGPVQINGRGDLTLEQRVQLELDYIENYTLGRDLHILLQTVPEVIRGNGSY
ncbi:MAG: sugar transferase [Anaerolineae bacterium]|jgi:lipopolysaccharide/colanic/teichoic acid biosynthesis glycosyltransferase/glycosyltransferase involved in cell wall biosynthesis